MWDATANALEKSGLFIFRDSCSTEASVALILRPVSHWKTGDLDLAGGGAIRSLPKNGGGKEFRGDPIAGPRPRSGPEIKNGKSSAKDVALERFSCSRSIQKEVIYILQLMNASTAKRILLSFYLA